MQNLSDKELYLLCKKYGENALMWRRRFIGLLPEVRRRRLHEKKGFASIFEFAKKLCGLSEEQVRRVLNLNKRFNDKPALRRALIDGEISTSKLARVVSVATTENEGFWAEKAKQLPKAALETLVKDVKIENESGLFKPQNEAKSVPGHRLELDEDVQEELLELQGKGIDVNALLKEFLEKRRQELTEEKEELGALPARSRYIPAKVRRHLKRERGDKCSIAHCHRPAQVIHHTQRFALAGTHDPRYLAPLCRAHHAIAHAIDAKVQANKSPPWAEDR